MNLPSSLAANQSIDEYEGVLYRNFDLVGHNSPQNIGIHNKSPPNGAAAQNVVASLIGGTGLTEFEYIGITTEYKGSHATSLSFKDFYFGCVIMAPTEMASIDHSCTLTAHAYKGGKMGDSASFDFKFSNVSQPMAHAVLPPTGFNNITNVTFTLTTNLVLPNGYLPGFLVDNLSYSVEST